ncbi:hypothetical protein SASPL_113410 [Salvia splendens]|uniref:Uncharacterized protein n=1 Tax=Salvia splendens TaxID=180675 RepID=A0A8X8ZZH1_SALSN|nr:hypothetical protein SASPL_113410 [Salvia splendens]
MVINAISHNTFRFLDSSLTHCSRLKIRLGIRLWHYVREEASHGRKAPIDPFTREHCKPSASQGVPLGGMGSGSISRGFRGEFRHFQILPGTCETAPVMANQFSIFISRDRGNKKYSSVLSPGRHEGLGKPSDQGISPWGWNLNGQHSTYHALFPRAWTVYDGEPDPELKISCRQISPFVPHNYRESSLPTSVFVYTLVNTGKERAKNSIGGTSHLTGEHVNEPFMTAKDNPPVTYAIAACETQNVSVSVLPCFSLNEGSCVTAKDMWDKMAQDGHFDRENSSKGPSMPSSPGETHCAAVSASTWVEPHGKCTIAFAVSWSSPKVKFCKGKSYHRRYTKYYGTSKNAAKDLVHDSLTKYMLWEEEIEKWQNPILKDDKLPEWYKFTLFNELYFLVAGGTVWIDSGSPMEDSVGIKSVITNSKKSKNQHVRIVHKSAGLVNESAVEDSEASVDIDPSGGGDTAVRESSDQEESGSCGSGGGGNSLGTSPIKSIEPVNDDDDDDNDVGKFLYLEGVEYIMWCTYDVHFYASFALLELFPKIELSIQREFANAVLFEDRRKVKFLAEGNHGIRKVKGAVPHDLGTHDPWHEMNAYNIHDTSRWKDLNPKFVLQVYRDFAATGDLSFGAEVWPAVCAAIDYMDQFDRDNDGMIENDGFPDQTYDAWTVHGISAYCGSLWLAALQAAATMAVQLGDQAFAEKCKNKFIKGKAVFEEKLWNGSYFNYDSGSSSNSKSIQADQLAGQWYTAASGLPDLFDDRKIRSALQKIHDFNVMKVQGGRIGAVNGMHPNGKVDESCMQSREVWTGVTYAAAATMIHAGMAEQAFTTAEGIFLASWSDEGYGYAFQTPEGWTTDGHFRSLIYMRPLAIWAMQWALSSSKTIRKAPVVMAMDRSHVPSDTANPSCNEGGTKKIAKKPWCFGNASFLIVDCSVVEMTRKMLVDGDLDKSDEGEALYDFDLFVIGAGSGGVRASRFSAQYGAKLGQNLLNSYFCNGYCTFVCGRCGVRLCVNVGICELPFHPISSEVIGGVGGTCVIRGCVPKKILFYGASFGSDLETEEIVRLNGTYKRLLANAGVKLFEGEGRVAGPNDVEVIQIDGTKLRYSAKHILISTGSRAKRPDIPGQELAITSDEALSLEELPKRAVILGGGYIALEFASIWRGMGVDVDLCFRKELPLRGFDNEMRALVARNLEARGITMHPWTAITERPMMILHSLATGRVPNAKRLNLESVGVELDSTTGAVKKTVFGGQPTAPDYDNVPCAVFCIPPLSLVGLSEEQALEKATGDILVFTSTFNSMKNTISGYAYGEFVLRQEKTIMKLVADAETDKVLGASMCGPDAPEIMQGIAVALKCGATKAQFDSTIGIHPSSAEEFVTMRSVTRRVSPSKPKTIQ